MGREGGGAGGRPETNFQPFSPPSMAVGDKGED